MVAAPAGGSAPRIAPAELAAAVERLAAAISADHPEGFVALGVLRGAVIVLADLVRAVTVPVEVDFLAIKTYAAGTGRVRLTLDASIELTGRAVVLVEDVVDTGLTVTFLRRELLARRPSSLRVCTLFDRSARRVVPVDLDYVGFDVGDAFLVGYGLDADGWYRNLPHVMRTDAGVLDDPARLASEYAAHPGSTERRERR